MAYSERNVNYESENQALETMSLIVLQGFILTRSIWRGKAGTTMAVA